ncbi:allantoinase [Halobacillus sp. Marseille-P3879]|uniref:allantoinase n=1 Tax=Halobacillus sp. Marseille-P3879 TaxID=2045014 RepID=UPI000C7AFF79|nr:allantoinase [Halobacillus sp. Marseille-P3879]
MSHYDTIIKNGNVVLEDSVQSLDIGITDGTISSLQESITASADKIYDAEGNYIFPGMIDVHVHLDEPGRQDWEGFTTGSRMLAAAGGTTFFDMPLNGIPSTTTTEALLEKAAIGKEKSIIDFGLWGGLVPGNESHIADLAAHGVIGFKAFLSPTGNKEFEAADDMTLLRGMKEIAKTGKLLALHAESGPIIQYLTEQTAWQKDITADDYAATRPIQAETEAVERAIHYAEVTGCPLHFVHISSIRAVELIEQAKNRGVDVSVETCAHYLLFSHDDLAEKGAVAKCAPPLRDVDEQQKLIQKVKESQFDMISSDHSPCPASLKDRSLNLLEAWGGISGGQFTLLTMIELALTFEIPFAKVAALTACRPAERFKLTRKGKITIGNDADLAIVDLNQPFHVSADTFHAKHKISLYMNHTFPCTIAATFSRGRLVFRNNDFPASQSRGTWMQTENKPSIV